MAVPDIKTVERQEIASGQRVRTFLCGMLSKSSFTRTNLVVQWGSVGPSRSSVEASRPKAYPDWNGISGDIE